MAEPQEVTDRRWRFNLVGAVESLANAERLLDLHDTELVERFFDCVTDECVAHGDRAMTECERSAVHDLCKVLGALCEEARLIKRERIGGKAVHGLDPEDLAVLGWFEKVQPLARGTFNIFMLRGWMSAGR